MTRIARLVMHGFKSFAKRTELVFDGNFNVVLGPNGSGKCVTGNTLVHLADGSLVEIRKLVEEGISREQPTRIDDGFIAKGDGRKIQCLDMSSLKVTNGEIASYVKRKSPEKLLKIITRSGRIITATPHHPLFVLSGNKVVAAKAEELKEGVRVAVPRAVQFVPESKSFYGLMDVILPEDGVYVLFNSSFTEAVRQAKGRHSWQELAKTLRIPLSAIKGLLDGQSINFSYLVRLLRHAGMDDASIAKLIPSVKGKTSGILCRIPWVNTPEFSRLLGYLLAEGRLAESSTQIWFTNGYEELVNDYSALIKKVFGLRVTINEYKPNVWDVLAYSEPLRVILGKFGMASQTVKKTITNLFLKHSGNEEISELLNGLYAGDGYVSDRSVELTTKSPKLATAVETMLTRLGITFLSKWEVKIATNTGFSALYRTIRVCGAGNAAKFASAVKFVHPMKKKRLALLVLKKGNPNVDLIEANALVKKVATELGLNVKKARKEFPTLDAYCYNSCLPSILGTRQLITGLFSVSQFASGSQSLKLLSQLVNSDIYWDEIKSIEEFASTDEWVYDLCVEGDHNFVANNIFVHNSNTLDALCFVLGRISSKELRTEKLSHLIYNGGKTKQPAAKAEVSIFFDNSRKTFPYPESQVKVGRIIKPSGQSVYRINDKASTRQEILDLLALARIDPDGHNIVLQGDIVRFVEMSAEERRQVVEEIAGISVYEEKKNKALSELAKVDERLKEAEILLSERKTHLKELKHDRDQALRYRELNDKIRANRATFLQLQMKQRESKKSETEKAIAANEKEISGLKSDIEKLRLAVAKKKEEISQLNEELEHRAEQEQVTIHRNIEQIRVGIGTNTSRISLDEGEIAKVRERREQLKSDFSDTESKISQLESSKQSLAEQVKKLSSDRAKLEANIHKLRGSVDSADLVRIEAELGSIDKETDEKQQLMQSLVGQKQSLLREKDKLEFRINTIDSSMDKIKEVERESRKEVDELQQRRNDFKKMVLELNQLLAKDSTLAAKAGENRKRISALNEEVAKARAKEAAIKERVLGNLAVKSILSQKSVRGVHGTVSQLGKVKTKYALALEVAAGPRINSLIVESDAVAAECINFLKSKKIGTASFLPLNKIKQAEERSDVNSLLKLPGVQGFAISLISFDEKFKPAFSYVFGNTIVVDSIEVARKIGIGKARMVTLDGDLAELSGAMHGGFRESRKEAMGFVDEEETQVADQLEHKLNAITAETSELEREKEDIEAAITKLRESKAAIEGDIIRMERSLHLESSDMDVSKKQKQELQEELKSVVTKLREADDKLLGQTRLVAELKSRRMQVREQITSLRNPAFLAELNALDKKKQELSDQIQTCENESKTTDVQINEVFSQEKAKLLQIFKQLDKDEEHFTAEKERLIKETEKLRKDLTESEAKSAKFQARHKELFAMRTKITEEVQGDDERIIRKEEQINTTEIKINNISIKKAEVAAELAGLNEEFSQYSDVKLLEGVSEDHIKSEISRFERLVTGMGNVNLKALEIYDDVEKQYNELLDKKEKLGKEKDDVLKMMAEIESKKKDLFMNTFTVLNKNFAGIFSQLSTKGEAHLMIENEENPFEAGVRIRVRLAGDKFLDIRGLSGGEKTLTALALIFAIQDYEPASFYVFDEVDAALDKRNSEKLAKLIKKYSERAQYLIISHNDALMAEGETLYGVSMDENGMSNVVSLKV